MKTGTEVKQKVNASQLNCMLNQPRRMIKKQRLKPKMRHT